MMLLNIFNKIDSSSITHRLNDLKGNLQSGLGDYGLRNVHFIPVVFLFAIND